MLSRNGQAIVQEVSVDALLPTQSLTEMLDILMRNITEPNRWAFAIAMSEATLKVGLPKYWEIFTDPFAKLTPRLFTDDHRTRRVIALFLSCVGVTSLKVPPPSPYTRNQIIRHPAYREALLKMLPAVRQRLLPQWQRLAQKGYLESRSDICLIRAAQTSLFLQTEWTEVHAALAVLLRRDVQPVLQRKQPRWEDILLESQLAKSVAITARRMEVLYDSHRTSAKDAKTRSRKRKRIEEPAVEIVHISEDEEEVERAVALAMEELAREGSAQARQSMRPLPEERMRVYAEYDLVTPPNSPHAS